MWVCLSNYGSSTHVWWLTLQSWTLTTEIEKKIDACENGWLRRLLRINYKDRITNREIRERTKTIQLSNSIRRMRMTWTGHHTYHNDDDVLTIKRWSKYSGGNHAAGDHEEGRRSAGWTVWKKIYTEQEPQDPCLDIPALCKSTPFAVTVKAWLRTTPSAGLGGGVKYTCAGKIVIFDTNRCLSQDVPRIINWGQDRTAESGTGVLGEGTGTPSPPLFSALTMASPDTIILLIEDYLQTSCITPGDSRRHKFVCLFVYCIRQFKELDRTLQI